MREAVPTSKRREQVMRRRQTHQLPPITGFPTAGAAWQVPRGRQCLGPTACLHGHSPVDMLWATTKHLPTHLSGRQGEKPSASSSIHIFL